MPYHIRKTSDGMAQVVKTSTGEPMSKHPIPLARARAQLKALYVNEPASTPNAQRAFHQARNRVAKS